MASKKNSKVVSDDCSPACASCAFFSLDEPKDEMGYCKRYPPIFVTDESGEGWTHSVSAFDDWCGEFKRKVQ